MIKIDIPMPRCCSDCFALHILDDFGDCRCEITMTDVFIELFIDDESKLDNCPLKEVSE